MTRGIRRRFSRPEPEPGSVGTHYCSLGIVAMLMRCMAGTVLLAGARTLAFRPPSTIWGVRGEDSSRLATVDSALVTQGNLDPIPRYCTQHARYPARKGLPCFDASCRAFRRRVVR